MNAGEVLHSAMRGGIAAAAMTGAVRRMPWAGPVSGLALWGGFELGIAPLPGLRHAQEPRPAERALYGFVLSEMRPRPRR